MTSTVQYIILIAFTVAYFYNLLNQPPVTTTTEERDMQARKSILTKEYSVTNLVVYVIILYIVTSFIVRMSMTNAEQEAQDDIDDAIESTSTYR